MDTLIPLTSIIHERSHPVDCKLVNDIPVDIDNATHLYDHRSGTTRIIQQIRKLPFFQGNKSDVQIQLSETIFREIVMLNFTDLSTRNTLNDLFDTMSQQRAIYHAITEEHRLIDPKAKRQANNFARKILQRGYLSFLTGFDFNLYQLCIFLCCAYITLMTLISFCIQTKIKEQFEFSLPKTVDQLASLWGYTKAIVSNARKNTHERLESLSQAKRQARATNRCHRNHRSRSASRTAFTLPTTSFQPTPTAPAPPSPADLLTTQQTSGSTVAPAIASNVNVEAEISPQNIVSSVETSANVKPSTTAG